MNDPFEPIILAFCCRWCSYAAADLAGSMRIQYPPNVKIIMIPCTGRIDVLYLLHALEKGSDGVFISGCLMGDCHYISGNEKATRRVAYVKKRLGEIGIEPERIEMQPNRSNNYCCGAGGGNWPMPYEEDSAWHGRLKYNQIKNSGADVLVVGCSNCRDQIMKRLPKYYKDYHYEVKYIWQLVAETLVLEPWTEEEVARAEAEAAAQWERLGVDLDEMEF